VINSVVQVQLGSETTSDLVMDGDYLKGSYRFSQLHFHWGAHEDKGSEHLVNGNGYVLELCLRLLNTFSIETKFNYTAFAGMWLSFI